MANKDLELEETEQEFIFDEEEAEALQKLQEIKEIISKKTKIYNPNAIFLRKFALALHKAAKKIYEEERKPKKIERKKEEKKPEIKKEEPKKIEIPKPKLEIPKPKLEVQQPKIELPKPPILEPLPLPKFKEYPLIVTKETGKELARARLKDNLYELIEPEINDIDLNMLNKLKSKFANKIMNKPRLIEDKKFLKDIIEKILKELKVSLTVDDGYIEKIKYYLIRDILGFSKIDALLKDSSVREIYCDGVKRTIYLTCDDMKLETNINYETDQEIDNLIEKFVRAAKIKIKNLKEEPFLDITFSGINLKAIRGLGIVSSRFVIKK